MVGAVLFYLIISITGAVMIPLAYRIFPALPSRGYAIARTLGLLLWGYLFWLLSSLGVLANHVSNYLFAFALLLGASVWVWRSIDREEWLAWFIEKRNFILTAEVLFLVAYIFLLLMRAMQPAATGAEKPMEVAFLNAFLRSDQMPPLDPWLSGYNISYYYFGYVLVGMLAKLSGVNAGISFNVGISLIFALSAIGSYGLIYDLLAALPGERKTERVGIPLLGPLFLLLVSNMEGFLEFLHGRGIFWTQLTSGEWTSKFWTWVNLEDLISPPPNNTIPGEMRYRWWWRASRVILDLDINGHGVEQIDEFPFFSYYLADLHPHVMAMPFVLVGLIFTLNIFLRREFKGKAFKLFRFTYDFPLTDFLLATFIFGGLGFLNLWDFPWYAAIFAGAHMLRKARMDGWKTDRLTEFILLVATLGIGGILLYIPFYTTFSSQAGGLLPNVINPTRGIHLWIMFGALFLPLIGYLIYLARKKRSRQSLRAGLSLGLIFILVMLGFSLLLTLSIGSYRDPATNINPFLGLYQAESTGQLIQLGLSRRVASIGSILTLTAILGLALGVLWPNRPTKETPQTMPLSSSHQFAGLMIVAGALMVIIPEFIYLRDFFNIRMNTIFKFYYQAWMVWAMAAAFGSAVILTQKTVGKLFQNIYRVILTTAILIGLTYTVMAINTRIGEFQKTSDPRLEIDGTATNYYLNDDEHAAVEWLLQAPLGALAEAVPPQGGAYTTYARISMNSGQPAVLGWLGHELQWRGGFDEIGSRQSDIALLYETAKWEEANTIIQQYDIVYIVVGNPEKNTYNLMEEKFIRNLTPVFQQGTVTIYQTDVPEK